MTAPLAECHSDVSNLTQAAIAAIILSRLAVRLVLVYTLSAPWTNPIKHTKSPRRAQKQPRRMLRKGSTGREGRDLTRKWVLALHHQ